MFIRFIVFQVLFVILAVASAIGWAVHNGVTVDDPATAARGFRQYPLPLGCACVVVAFLAAFGGLWLPGKRKSGLPTYTDEEFIAKFGGSSADSQQ
jgi:hypothetical protein